jgi:hypothetical protein
MLLAGNNLAGVYRVFSLLWGDEVWRKEAGE